MITMHSVDIYKLRKLFTDNNSDVLISSIMYTAYLSDSVIYSQIKQTPGYTRTGRVLLGDETKA